MVIRIQDVKQLKTLNENIQELCAFHEKISGITTNLKLQSSKTQANDHDKG